MALSSSQAPTPLPSHATHRPNRLLSERSRPLRYTMHRVRRRRSRPPDRVLPISLSLALAALTAGLLLLGACQASMSTADVLINGTQEMVAGRSLNLPFDRRLDSELPQTALITARNGTPIKSIDDVHFGRRVSVPLAEISPLLVQATLAAEDRRFFEHQGVDPLGLVRALRQNAASDGVASGASTLDMQLVRNLYLEDERHEQTLSRKLTEAITSYRLSQRYSKQEILEAYLNTVYYGNHSYGAEAAAQRYFGKSARDLTLPEAALLAGVPQNPTAHDPLHSFDLAKARQEHILNLMVEAGFVSWAEAQAARAMPLRFQEPEPIEPRAPHLADYVQRLLRERYGPELLFTGGLRVQTTVDLEIQALAEQIVAQNESVRQLAGANNTALVVIDPDSRQVLAMVGSKDFSDESIDGQFNVATAGRQPGSSIKPLVFLSGFEHGLNPGVTVLDQRTDFPAPPGQPPYRPANYEDKYFGLVTLRDALGNSLNVPAVKVLQYVGVPALQDMARRLGITTLDDWDPQWLSLTLGGGEVQLVELTGAYATIAQLGEYRPIEPFVRVETSRGAVLHEAGSDRGRQVVDPRVDYQLLHVMGDSGARLVTFGPNSPLNLDRPHMVKTGTTDDYRDTWTLGCLPQVCVGVWMGNTDNRPMQKTSSSLTAGKVWLDMMQALVARYEWPPEPFPRPDGVVVERVPAVGGARPGQSSYEEVFLPGQTRRFALEQAPPRAD